MKKHKGSWLIIVSLIVALAVAGPGIHNRELIDVTLLQTLGVDGEEWVTLTAVAPSDDKEPPQRYRTQADSLAEAREAARASDFIRKHLPPELLTAYCGK